MSEVDPDPYEPGNGRRAVELGGSVAPEGDDPTQGGKHGQIGAAPSIASDEPDAAGEAYPVGGGSVTEESNAPPAADPGSDG